MTSSAPAARGMTAGVSTPSRTPHRRGGGGRPRAAELAALPDRDTEQLLTQLSEQRARQVLDDAAAQGQPMIDPTGRQRSYITLPEYTLGRAPANKGQRYPAEVLSQQEVMAMLDVMPRSATGARNRCLIVVLWRAGLRISEALSLHPKDVDLDLGAITVLRGKGAKRRVVAIDAMTRRYIEVWLHERAKLAIPAERVDHAPLLCTLSRDASGPGRPWQAPTVRNMLKDYARRAGVRKRVHPHGLRHTCAFDLSQDGVPMTHIQAQLGHQDLAMTDHYVSHLAPVHLFRSIGERPCPDDPQSAAPEMTSQALSAGAAVQVSMPTPSPLDPPEPKAKAAPRGAAAHHMERSRQLRAAIPVALRANGGSATQAQLARALDTTTWVLSGHMRALHDAGVVRRAGYDRYRSIIWKLAGPTVVLRTTPLRCAPNGEGPLRVLDAVDALGGRGSQADLAQLLELDIETVRGHCITLEASGHLIRGGLDRSRSRRGSQVWRFAAPAQARYRVGLTSGHTMRFSTPA